MSEAERKPAGKGSFLFLIFSMIFVVAGGSFAFMSIIDAVEMNATSKWSTASGVVLESSVESPSSRSSGVYHARVVYQFYVDEVLFKGNRIAHGSYGSSNSSHAKGIASRYHKGKRVTVSYMPDNPEKSLLEPGLKAQGFIPIAGGLVFFVLGCIMTFFKAKSLRKRIEKDRLIKEEGAVNFTQ